LLVGGLSRGVPYQSEGRVVRALVSRGYNAEREAVTLLAGADDPAALDRVVEAAPEDALTITAAHVREALSGPTPDVSTGANSRKKEEIGAPSGSETKGVESGSDAPDPASTSPSTPGTDRIPGDAPVDGTPAAADSASTPDVDSESDAGTGPTAALSADAERTPGDPEQRQIEIEGDITGESTGTGEYGDFVAVFRDRYERLARQLRGRVNHRPTGSLATMAGGQEAAVVGMVNDVRSTASGHWLVELEDTNGVFPALVTKDRDLAGVVDELLLDEVIAVEGTLSDDAGILFADDLHFPDVPRTHSPSTADRHVQAALISDIHVGSQEFAREEWDRFAAWLHTEAAERIEYLLIAGDMVEGVGVYPGQDEELDIVDIYEQYETFSEHLKDVPGDIEILMIPGNHDAVRLAEPQPAFDENLREIMSAHDATVTGNPSTVTVEGVSVLLYHGVSLDEVIAELPAEKASYEEPHKAMYQLLKKRHVAPQYGGKLRVAPEDRDYLAIDDVPDIFHTGHVHKLGFGKYHNVLAVNSGCWQYQTEFQKRNNIDPDYGYAPVVDLDTLDVTLRKFH
jgi:DNA polymerase II small subunit